jgi:hypothetical protein
MSLAGGLFAIYVPGDHLVSKIIVGRRAVIDLIKIVDDKYLVTAGIDPKVRVWSVDSERVVGKFALH